MHKFSLLFGVDFSINPKIITLIPYHFISVLLITNLNLTLAFLMTLLSAH